MQKVLVFQRDKMGAGKVKAIAELGIDAELRVVDVDGPFAPIVDDPESHFPADVDELLAWADLVLDHLYHPDLTGFLVERAEVAGKTVIASGRKLQRALTPTTCCTLGRREGLGEYGEKFGAPEFKVTLGEGGVVDHVDVVRGAPCGATWRAAEDVAGMPADEAIPRIGLATQFHCYAKANPNVFLTNPLHVAGEVHAAALKKAVKRAGGKVSEKE